MAAAQVTAAAASATAAAATTAATAGAGRLLVFRGFLLCLLLKKFCRSYFAF